MLHYNLPYQNKLHIILYGTSILLLVEFYFSIYISIVSCVARDAFFYIYEENTQIDSVYSKIISILHLMDTETCNLRFPPAC